MTDEEGNKGAEGKGNKRAGVHVWAVVLSVVHVVYVLCVGGYSWYMYMTVHVHVHVHTSD